ncbi:MAG TPA: hypothetical protein VIT38_12745 [Allosphingosinicella sp.]
MDQNQSPFAVEGTTDGPASEPPTASESPDFDPVTLRDRSDGWTPRKQREFIEALADTGLVREAAARVGMTEQSASRLRRRADAGAFDIAWDAALRQGAARLRAIAWERAIEGTIKHYFYQGEIRSEVRIFDNRLLIYLLGRTNEHRAPEREAERALGDWEGWMAMIERGDPPPPPLPEPKPEPKPGEKKREPGPVVWLEPGRCLPSRRRGKRSHHISNGSRRRGARGLNVSRG